MSVSFLKVAPVSKFDPELGIVFGFSIVSKRLNDDTGLVEDYYDTGYEQDGEWYHDHIPEGAMLSAALKYADSNRVAGDMHKAAAGQPLHPKLIAPVGPASDPYAKVEVRGDVPFLFPLTSEIAAALEITSKSYGLLSGIRPDDALREEFVAGNYTGFSIGGLRIRDRVLEE